MGKILGESTGARVGRGAALAAAALIAAGCGSSSSGTSPNAAPKPAAHEVVNGQQHKLRELARMCLGLKASDVYEVDRQPHHTTTVDFEDGPVPPTRDERTCTVNEARIAGHLVPTAVSFGRADGLHATMKEVLTTEGQAVSVTSIVVHAATGSRERSEVGIHSMSGGPEFPIVAAVGIHDLGHATPIPEGA
jgi:hypothetical protein